MSRLEQIRKTFELKWVACDADEECADCNTEKFLIAEAEKVPGLEADIERWRGRQATDQERIVELEAEVKRLRERARKIRKREHDSGHGLLKELYELVDDLAGESND